MIKYETKSTQVVLATLFFQHFFQLAFLSQKLNYSKIF